MLAHGSASKLGSLYPEYGYNEAIDYPHHLEVEELSAMEFIRRLYGLDKLPEHLAKLYEAQEDFHQETRKVLAKILGVTNKTARDWGRQYQKMPRYYRLTLGYAFLSMCHLKEVHLRELESNDNNRGLRLV